MADIYSSVGRIYQQVLTWGKKVSGSYGSAIAIILAVIAFLIALVFIWELLLIPALFLAAAFSTYYRRFRSEPPAFELLSLGTVTVGMAYGSLFGALFGGFAELVAHILNRRISVDILWYITSRIAMGALAGMFAAGNVLVVGMALVVVSNIVAEAIPLWIGDAERKLQTVGYIFLNIPINFVLFGLFGNVLLGLLG